MRQHRTLLLLSGPVLLLACCAAWAAQGGTPALRPPPVETVVSDPPAPPEAAAPTPTPTPEAARGLSTVADTGRFLTLPDGALDALAQRLLDKQKSHHPIVVVQYGDSHTQAAVLPRELRNALAGGGLTSPGFVAPGLHNVGDASCNLVGRWDTHNWLRSADSGSFGPLGSAYVTRDLRARIHLHLKSPPPAGATLTAFYKRASNHLPFQIEVDGAVLKTIHPTPVAATDRRIMSSVQVTLPAGTTDVELAVAATRRAGPELRFFGFLVQYPGAVVEWDALGVQGTSVDHPLNRGDHALEEYLEVRQPDLIVVWYGSNTLVAPNFEPASYGKAFGAFLSRLRSAAPQAARVAIGPPDLARRPDSCAGWIGAHPTAKVYVKQGRHRKLRVVKRRLTESERAQWTRFICEPEQAVVQPPGKPIQYPVKDVRTAQQWAAYLQSCQISTLPAVMSITEAERDAAKREGFAFFDTYAFMDGAGSIHRWACQEPQLARFDHVHLTNDGYATVAQGVWAALQGPLHATGLKVTGAGESLPPATTDDEADTDPN